jgi:hypothetical protein
VKEPVEQLNRLLDLHDRVKATRESTFDARAALTLFNQLMLPILAVLLSNLDKLSGLIP